MADRKGLEGNLHRGKKYLDLCFNWIFLEFLRKSANPIKSTLILSIYPLFLLLSWFFMGAELSQFKIGENFTMFANLVIFFGAFYQSIWKYFSFLLHYKKMKRILIFIEDIQTSIQSQNLFSNIRNSVYDKTLKYYVFFGR